MMNAELAVNLQGTNQYLMRTKPSKSTQWLNSFSRVWHDDSIRYLSRRRSFNGSVRLADPFALRYMGANERNSANRAVGHHHRLSGRAGAAGHTAGSTHKDANAELSNFPYISERRTRV